MSFPFQAFGRVFLIYRKAISCKAKKRETTKFKAAAKARDKFYSNYINEIAKSNKLRSKFKKILIFGCIVVVIGFALLVGMVINILN